MEIIIRKKIYGGDEARSKDINSSMYTRIPT